LEKKIDYTLIYLEFNSPVFFCFKPNTENSFEKTISKRDFPPYYDASWTKLTENKIIKKYKVHCIPNREEDEKTKTTAEKKQEMETKERREGKAGRSKNFFIKIKDMKSWQEVIELNKKNDFLMIKKPIYSNQYQKFIDILHYIFHAKRNYPNNQAKTKLIKVYFPIDIIPTNEKGFVAGLLKTLEKETDPKKKKEGYDFWNFSIRRNALVFVVLQEEEIYNIYGDAGITPECIEDTISKERKELADLILNRLHESENQVIQKIMKDLEDENKPYESNADYIEIWKIIQKHYIEGDKTYFVENVYLDKPVFFIDLFHSEEKAEEFTRKDKEKTLRKRQSRKKNK